ncbi:MAG TPA: aminotransferase class I/II-fold pyridoxal phosphate-dependent enzyme [Thermoanaerobaculaceae bacterium]|nr:aminotransferase class I/II-fold pyridoxal phosphate-dependent enzyme [Thermoanaerobaculaceae bacterium]
MEQKLSPGVQRYVDMARETGARRAEFRAGVRRLKFDTIAVHGTYGVEEAFAAGQGGIIEPVFPSTSQAYRDSDEMEAGLGYLIPTWCYSRIHNPTVFYLEETLALLESYGCTEDASGLCTSSGMSAIKLAVEPLLAKQREEHEEINFVSAAQVYGGTFQAFNVRMRERGAKVRFVAEPWDLEAWRSQVDENTRFIYGEMPSNPQQSCFDVAAVAALAHRHGIPLIVDSTVATPALMRPLAHGADVVVHSLTKTVGAGGFSIGGGIVARHNLTSRHLADEAKKDYATWLKLWPFRDAGPCMSANSAFMFLNELRTLRLKMERFSANTMAVARFLEQHPRVERVDYLGLPHHRQHELASRYLRLVDDGTPTFGHLMSFDIKGSPADTRRFFDALQRIYRATDLGRIKSVATLPAISTHSQQGEEGRKLAGIPPTMVRLCVGGEHPDDVIADLEQALGKI